jgi:hypothetical protein
MLPRTIGLKMTAAWSAGRDMTALRLVGVGVLAPVTAALSTLGSVSNAVFIVIRITADLIPFER